MIKKQFTDSIGAWKIVCTYMIVILHYGGAVGWKLAVEFFFIVAGLLMAYEYDIKNTEYLQYISKRILRLWPHYIFSFVVFIVVSMIMDGGGVKFSQLFLELRYSILEIFMLQILGIGNYAKNHGAVWYVSALMISTVFLYGLLKRFGTKKSIRLLMCIVCIFVGYCARFVFGDMCIVTYETSEGLCLIPGLVRGISEMAIGIECYYIGKWLTNKGIFEEKRKQWIIIEVVIMTILTVYTRWKLDCHVGVIFSYAIIAVIAFFVRHNERFSRYSNKLGKYTYAIYLNHPIILIICAEQKLWIVLLIVTIYSIITTESIDKIENIVMKRKGV